MEWFAVSLATTFESGEVIQDILLEEGAGGVEVNDPALFGALEGRLLEADEPLPVVALPPDRQITVKAYFHGDAEFMGKLESIRLRIDGLVKASLIGDTTLEVDEITDDDWAHAWKQYFAPVRIGRCFLVVPSWKSDEAQEILKADRGIIPLYLDPGMAFGTGNHPTTALCLEAMETVLRPGGRFLDVGTGSGILAIAAAKMGCIGKAFDIDSLAVAVAAENLRANGVDPSVDVFKCDLTDSRERAERGLDKGDFEFVVANIVAEVIVRLLPHIRGAMEQGGKLVCSGIVESKLHMVLDAMKEHGYRLERTLVRDEWRTLIAVKG